MCLAAFNKPVFDNWHNIAARRLSSCKELLTRWRPLSLSDSVKMSAVAAVSLDSVEAECGSVGQGFVDTHCHLDMILPRLAQQSEKDARKAKAKGKEPPSKLASDFSEWRATLQGPESALEGCITIGCDAKSLDCNAAFLEYDGVRAAFGIHPEEAADWSIEVENKLVDMMSWEKVVAWGECGLDFYDKDTKGQIEDPEVHALQRQVFARQMDLAASLGKPLIVHTRHAEEDTLELMMKHLPASQKVHVHCFTSSLSLAQALLKHFPNLYLGFTGVITFKNALEVQEVVRRVPLNRLLLETDGPFMAPVPYRGRVAHPGYAVYVAGKIAELKGLTLEEVLIACRENTRRVYGF